MAVRKHGRLLSLVAALALVVPHTLLAAGVVDERPSMGEMLVDGVVVRPLGLGATILGCATWLVTLPFSALGGNFGEATQKLVVQPAEFTFTRPLGEL
jgi:hypothetical protein